MIALGVARSAATGLPVAQAAPAPYEAVHYWSKIHEDTVKKVGGAPGPLTRTAAIMHLAMYDAANSVTPIGHPYLAKQPLSGPTSLNAAIATAAYTVLHSVYPSVNFDGNYGFALSQDPSSVPQADKDRGVAVGRAAGQALLNARAQDGSGTSSAYTPDGAPGAWQPTGSGNTLTPHWGNVRPFALTAPAQFRPGLPGGFAGYDALLRSAQYAEQVNEVRTLGGHTDTAVTKVTRTAEQTEIAHFWANDLDGTYKPPLQLFQHTRIIARKYTLSVTQNARLFALLSGHATFAGGWAGVLRTYFNTDAVTFSATTTDTYEGGITRRFTTLSAAANENALSRIYLGVHYRWDSEQGLTVGNAVARHTTDTLL